jgi:hypothetical protein
VELHEVAAAPGTRYLWGRGFLRAPIELRHKKDLVAVSVAQRLSHADFAGATIVVPTVVHEGDASIDGAADESDAFLFIGLFADVIATETDGRYLLAGASKALRFPFSRARRGVPAGVTECQFVA